MTCISRLRWLRSEQNNNDFLIKILLMPLPVSRGMLLIRLMPADCSFPFKKVRQLWNKVIRHFHYYGPAARQHSVANH